MKFQHNIYVDIDRDKNEKARPFVLLVMTDLIELNNGGNGLRQTNAARRRRNWNELRFIVGTDGAAGNATFRKPASAAFPVVRTGPPTEAAIVSLLKQIPTEHRTADIGCRDGANFMFFEIHLRSKRVTRALGTVKFRNADTNFRSPFEMKQLKKNNRRW